MSLIFAYDVANPKSWKGRPTTNYLVTSSFGQSFGMGRSDRRPFNSTSHSGNGKIVQGTGFTFTPGSAQRIPEKPVDEDCEIWFVRDSNPDQYSRFSPYNGINIDNDLPSYDVSYVCSTYIYLPPNVTLGNSNDCPVAQNTTGTDWHTGGSTTATYNATYNFWAANIRNSQSTANTSQRGSWQRIWNRFTPSSTVRDQEVGITINRLGGFMRPNLVGQAQENYYFVAASQIELGTTPSPYVYGSRTNTDSLLDVTGNYTITQNNLTYNDDNTFSFDGTDDYLTLSTPITLSSSSATLSCWAFVDDFTTGKSNPGRTLIRFTANNYQRLIAFYDGGIGFETNTNSDPLDVSGNTGPDYFMSGITSQSWFQFTIVFNSGTAYLYSNGNFISSVAIADNLTFDRIGDGTGFLDSYPGFMKGKISEMKVYDTPLTSDEIKKDYESSKYKYL